MLTVVATLQRPTDASGSLSTGVTVARGFKLTVFKCTIRCSRLSSTSSLLIHEENTKVGVNRSDSMFPTKTCFMIRRRLPGNQNVHSIFAIECVEMKHR